jgi:hypothetical protein
MLNILELKEKIFSQSLELNLTFLLNIYVNLNLLFIANFYKDPLILIKQPFIKFVFEVIQSDHLLVIVPLTSLIVSLFLTFLIFVVKKLMTESLNVLFFSTIIITLFYLIKINSISRVYLVLFVLVIWIDFILSNKVLVKFFFLKLIFLLIIIFIPYILPNTLNETERLNFLESNQNKNIFSEWDAYLNHEDFKITFEDKVVEEFFNYEKLNSCINKFSNDGSEILNNYFIVGHAYGNSSNGDLALSQKLLDYFDKKSKNIILTGDVVFENNIENLNLAKQQLNTRFDNHYIAVGNHDLSQEYYKTFKDDLFLLSENSVDLIVANFSTYNWKPTVKDQFLINEFIKQSNSKTVIIFSHFVVWFHLTEEPVAPNGIHFLLKEPKNDHLDWLEIDDKNLIFISGDYGNRGRSIFCEYQEENSRIFIANGISNNSFDTILNLNIFKNSFNFNLLELKQQ